MRLIIKGIFVSTILLLFVDAYAADVREKREAYAAFDEVLKSGRIVGKVYFDLKASSLDLKAKKDLNEIAKELLKLKASFLIRLEGYADSSLEKNDGVLLSIQRAQAVKLYMSGRFPDLKVDMYMTGFGETKPVISEYGVSPGEIMRKDRRVDLVVYSGASFFAEPADMKVVGKLGDKKVVAKKLKVEKGLAPVVTVSVVRGRPVVTVSVVRGRPVVTVSVVRRKRSLFVSTKSVKRYILPDVFFDEESYLKDEAKSVLANVVEKVRHDSRWIYLAGRDSYKGQKNWLSSKQLKKQVLVATELVNNQGFSPDRMFIQGIDSSMSPYGNIKSDKGAVYLYIPLR